MKLYTYFRSSASFRVRIGLNLKGLGYEVIPVHLTRGGGEQFTAAYKMLNPQGLVPVLVDTDQALHQSLAVLEYLNEIYPSPALLPEAPADRARVRALALDITCEIHPLNNLRVLNYLTQQFGLNDAQKTQWYQHWVTQGFEAIEMRLSRDSRTGQFCHGNIPTIADCCLVPQVFNAKRFECDLAKVPTLMRIFKNCMELEPFIAASPENQPDFT